MVDGFTRSLQSLRKEMALSDGATEERPDGAYPVGPAQGPSGGPETLGACACSNDTAKGGQEGKPPTANPGGSTHDNQAFEGSDSDEPPRPRRRLRRGRPLARDCQT